MDQLTRRQLLAATGVTGALILSGCTGDDDDGNGVDDDTPADVPQRIHNYMRNARGYQGTLTDRRERSEVTVEVGAGDQGLAFEPAAMRIDTDTTVIWEWTGMGGVHDVHSVGASDFSFESPRTAEAGATFTFTFDTGGVALYDCRPHRTQRMLGAIEVMFPDDEVAGG